MNDGGRAERKKEKDMDRHPGPPSTGGRGVEEIFS
jgi:hypothetical protein